MTISDAAQIRARAHLVGARAEHHDPAVEVVQRLERVLDQRPAVDARELLRPAEAAALACGQQDPRAHPSAPSIRSASCSKDAMVFPGSRRSRCGMAATMPRVSGS